jgi:branched-chain amino acid transport system ATP-binding protein
VSALFEARGIVKRFGGLTAVNDVTFGVDSGIASIIGPNGAGKTTLFNVFTGLYHPDEGEIAFRGKPLVGLRADEITALGVCRTFQNIRLFANMTAAENVLVGMHSRVRLGVRDVLVRTRNFRDIERALWQRAGDLLERVGLRGKGNEIARSLPYGEQRRLELARALGSEPALLLLDEPTAGLAQSETPAMVRLLRALPAELTLLIVEHNLELIFQVVDRVVVLHEGRVIVDDDAPAVRENPEVRELYFGSGAGRADRPHAAPAVDGAQTR